jgi:hypothetical protein
MRPLLLTAALAATALAAAGCTAGGTTSSAGSFEGAEADVAKVVDDLQSTGERQDADRICSELLARELVDRLDAEGTSCGQEIENATKDADEFAMTVRDVTVTGTTASAQVRQGAGDGGPTRTLRFAREDGRWKLADLG